MDNRDSLFSPDQFEYTILPAIGRSGVEIVVVRVKTGEQKRFYLAGEHSFESLHLHMCSLTDDLLTSFFVKGGKPPKKKAVQEQKTKIVDVYVLDPIS